MNKELAVLIGGEYREFDSCWKSWDFLRDLSHDVFMSTWSTTERFIGGASTLTEETITRQQVLNVIQQEPKFLNIQDQLGFRRRANKQIYHWHTVIANFLPYKNNYKCALIIRPDLFVGNNDFVKFVRTYQDLEDRLYTSGPMHKSSRPPHNLTVMDQFFISSPEKIIENILTLPYQPEKPENYEIPDLHGHMAAHYNSRGEDVLGLHGSYNFCLMRPNTRGIENIDYETALRLGKEWVGIV
jgi:hypothetical protein